MFKVVEIGEVYICDFGDGVGSMQGGVRPCVIVDNKDACVFSPCVHCVPLTSQYKKDMPLHYILTKGDCDFLDKESVALCEQYTLVDKSQLWDCIGRVKQIDLIRMIELCKKNLPYQYK